eukprot:763527-Hanusia_phi.AAC.4
MTWTPEVDEVGVVIMVFPSGGRVLPGTEQKVGWDVISIRTLLREETYHGTSEPCGNKEEEEERGGRGGTRRERRERKSRKKQRRENVSDSNVSLRIFSA